jgi:hypothetical protein
MPEEITYYAIVNDRSTEDEPVGVLRHFNTGGHRDESFAADLQWQFSPLLHAAARGDTEYDLIPITEGKANQIVARIRDLHPGGE